MNARNLLISVLVVMLLLSACGAPATPAPAPTSTLTPKPKATSTPESTQTSTTTPTPEASATATIDPNAGPVQLEGSVLWASNNDPIPDFGLELGDTDELKVTTGADGKYSLTDLEPGKYPLTIVWEMDKSGKPMPCDSFQISFPSSIISGTALSMSGTNPTGRIFLSVGYEIDLSRGGPITVDFKIECN